ncbi:MAG: hypothetical protein MK052_10055 [Alphaproteobacteria bacterium]|nr:hypothetical protein [Alphaproteobacteria bacterium]
MASSRINQDIKPLLLQKELLLYEATQSRMAYTLPLFLIFLGLLFCFPATWDFLYMQPKLAELYPHAYHLMYEMKFAAVLICFGFGILYQRNRAARKSQHFVTNMRVVEHSKTLLHEDIQYILLHHIKLVRVKANPMQMLTFCGRVILEDDLGYEHIEIPNVSLPTEFRKAILHAKDRFDEVSRRTEKDGLLKQTQSDKSKREQKAKQRKEQRKQEREDAEKKQREQEAKDRMNNGGYY